MLNASLLHQKHDEGLSPAIRKAATPYLETVSIRTTLVDSTSHSFDLQQTTLPSPSVLHVLILEDDGPVRRACCEIIAAKGFQVVAVEDVDQAREILKNQFVDLLLLDLNLPKGSGLTFLREVKALHPAIEVMVMTAFATVPSVVETMQHGAADYLTKPFALDDLTVMLEGAARKRRSYLERAGLRRRERTEKGMGSILGQSPGMEKLFRIMGKVAMSNHPVLILGESGTGKEMVAQTIHNSGLHAAKLFVTVDCGSLVSTLIESELFGYVKGAFTGANRDKTGLLAAAQGGTVFLDEIGELPLELQTKLLRALQEKEIRPVGSTRTVPISARILAATNRDLVTMVEQGKFRKDLYYRLNVVNLKVPPLRERRSDIPLLVEHFLERQMLEKGRVFHFSEEVLRWMTEYNWPGNIRELEHAISHMCALSSGPELDKEGMPTQLQEFRRQSQSQQAPGLPMLTDQQTSAVLAGVPLPGGPGTRIVTIADMERHAIFTTIQKLKGDKLLAAKLLGIGKTTLYRKLKEYGIEENEDA